MASRIQLLAGLNSTPVQQFNNKRKHFINSISKVFTIQTPVKQQESNRITRLGSPEWLKTFIKWMRSTTRSERHVYWQLNISTYVDFVGSFFPEFYNITLKTLRILDKNENHGDSK